MSIPRLVNMLFDFDRFSIYVKCLDFNEASGTGVHRQFLNCQIPRSLIASQLEIQHKGTCLARHYSSRTYIKKKTRPEHMGTHKIISLLSVF